MECQLGCMTIPYRHFTLQEAFAGIAAAGFKYVCPGPHHFGRGPDEPEISAEKVDELNKLAEEHGLKIVMIFGCRGPLKSLHDVQTYKQDVDVCAALGAPYLLTMGPWAYAEGIIRRKPDEEWNADVEAYYRWMKPVAQYAGEKGVTILIKPHANVCAHASLCVQTIQAIGSPHVRICYDGGNVHFYEGIDPHIDLSLCADYVRALVVKNHRGGRGVRDFPPPAEGDVDHARLLRILSEHNFSGPVVVERLGDLEELAAINEEAKKAFRYLTEILGSLS